MRLYKAVCAWLEANATQMSRTEPPREPGEPHPEGNNFSQAEHAHSYTSEPELHTGYTGISIDYDEDHGGVYRSRPIGFQRNPQRAVGKKKQP
ncbi:hypothetical protein LJ753_16760 [Arthrobacter sp. zg-Y20]|uniref:hypothetical protein n=1 Tax=unclassified Arthrobacter TaxID=235627 RepID=UPI001D137FEA|nr:MULTISPECIES: hypothetical protein [unclassified Arthrobacter]MCC3277517.1 hypothetical protein [Arthrobacter sp. zg-Y20]MDK1317677.1 hypothetical protein [Arthrobacter sp. zg.Y20]WIB07064.1 hypothetical protein QNO06_04870 [Arthrobacter sp. zg-Y20]